MTFWILWGIETVDTHDILTDEVKACKNQRGVASSTTANTFFLQPESFRLTHILLLDDSMSYLP